MNDYRPFHSRRVLVITDGVTFDGTLMRTGKHSLTLTRATAVAPNNDRTPIDGEVVVPLSTIIWTQVP